MPASSFSRIQRAPIIPTRTPLRTIHKVERKRGGTGRAEDVAIRITLEGLRRELSRVEGTRVGQWRRHRLKVVRHAIKLAEAAEDGGVPAELAALLESLSL